MTSPLPDRSAPVLAIVNEGAGTAAEAQAALAATNRFEVRELAGDAIGEAVREAVARGARRVVVAGGDGTVGAAAAAVIGSETELAVLPGGTLNHFARDLGIPTDLTAAAEVAAGGAVRRADVASVNGRIFLNTSSVGAYVVFVRAREQLERHMGYRLASVLAAVRTLWRLHRFQIELEVAGERRTYVTPLVFIGVGERELRLPLLGNRVPDGEAGLQVFVVRGRTRAALFALALAAAARGVKVASATPRLDSFVVDRLRIVMRRPRGNVAVDGELVPMVSPLEYEIHRDALAVVVPAPTPDDGAEPPRPVAVG
jgi:diacylglycerol kinase family enzyme